MPDQIVTYRALIEELEDSGNRFTSLAVAFSRLQALFNVLSSEAREQQHATMESLAELGSEAADSAEDRAYAAQDSAKALAAHARTLVPKREWRKAGFPCEPDAEELAQEQAFAILVTEFPKQGFDGNAKLRCVIEKEKA
jgi:hypothetical protein